MRERLSFEREIGRLESDPCQQVLRKHAAALSVPLKAGQPAQFAEARSVMWQLIAILAKTQTVREADPDRVVNPPDWYKTYKSLLRQWYQVSYGVPLSDKSRQQAKGAALQRQVDAAFKASQPVLSLLNQHGGTPWAELLRACFYPRVAELDELAAETGPKMKRSAKAVVVDIPHKPPRPVTYAEFMMVATRPAQAQPLQRGIGGTQFGSYKPGSAFSLAGGERRVVLWTGGDVVFFLRNGQIFAQRGPGFSDDVLMGTIIKGYEDAAGAVLLAQMMIDIGLSMTPWGVLWDGISALRDISNGDWAGAASSFLPGVAMESGKAVRAIKRASKGGSVSNLAKEVAGLRGAADSSYFVGGGGYQTKTGWRRGTWMIEQKGAASGAKGGSKRYRFFDQVDRKVVEVKEADALAHVRCSYCHFTAHGLNGAIFTEVDRQLNKIARAPGFGSRGRSLVPRKVVDDLVRAYGADADDIIDNILNTWSSTKSAQLVEDSMVVATQLAPIKGKFGFQDAADIFDDLASSSTMTARGAQFELEWAAKHVDEIDAMGVPMFMKNWKGVGKGLDILKKNGLAVELKNYDFTRWIYANDPGRAAAGIKRQALSRLRWKNPPVAGVTFVFSSRAGPMPAAFKAELDKVSASLAKQFKQPITFEFWPPPQRSGLSREVEEGVQTCYRNACRSNGKSACSCQTGGASSSNRQRSLSSPSPMFFSNDTILPRMPS